MHARVRMCTVWVAAFVVFFLIAPLASGSNDPLLTLGGFRTGAPPDRSNLRIVSFNLHGPPTKRIGSVTEALKTHPALVEGDVLALQEVNRNHRGSGQRDVALHLARELQMDYAYAVELAHAKGGGFRGLALLSRYPMSEVERFVLPVEGPGGRRRIALAATVHVGQKRLRVYNTHLETRISSAKRGEQIVALLDHANRDLSQPTIVAGDFNTFTGAATRKMFSLMEEAGFHCPLPGDRITFQVKFLVRLKLDWIWVRGAKSVEAKVESEIKVSDHRPLWVTVETGSGGTS